MKLLNDFFSEMADKHAESLLNSDQSRQHLNKIINTHVPTPYENPIFYHQLKRFAGEIDNVLREMGISLPYPIILGSIQTPDPNAMIWLSDNHKAVVIAVHVGMHNYFFRMAQILYLAVDVEDAGDGYLCHFEKDKILARLSRHQEVYLHFLKNMDAMIMHGGVQNMILQGRTYSGVSRIVLDDVRQFHATLLNTTVHLFAIAHEYGHVLSGHLSPEKTHLTAFGKQAINKLHASYAEEYEADTVGMILTLNALGLRQTSDLANAYMGIDFLFSAQDIFERALSTVLFGDERKWMSPTHPPAYMRREHLRDALNSYFQPQTQADKDKWNREVQGSLKMSRAVQDILELFWDRVHDDYEEYHRKGLSPAIVWHPARV